MATETKQPDTLTLQTALTGDVTDLQSDPDSPDANWLDYDGVTNSDTETRATLPTPTGDPTVGADLQEFRVQIRKNATGGNSTTWSLQLAEDGASVRELATGTTTALAPDGEVVSGTWNANELGTADGSLVECWLVQTGGGGSGAAGNRRRIEVGGMEWNITYSAPATPKTADLGPDDLDTWADSLKHSWALDFTDDAANLADSFDVFREILAELSDSLDGWGDEAAFSKLDVPILASLLDDLENWGEAIEKLLGILGALSDDANQWGDDKTIDLAATGGPSDNHWIEHQVF